MINHKITVGLTKTSKREGTIKGTILSSNNSGDLGYLLSTPEVLKIILETSSNMRDPFLPLSRVTIGKYIELSHEQPTLKLSGSAIKTVMTVKEIINNKIILDFTCYDDFGLICKGKYERDIVDKNKLMDITYNRVQNKL